MTVITQSSRINEVLSWPWYLKIRPYSWTITSNDSRVRPYRYVGRVDGLDDFEMIADSKAEIEAEWRNHLKTLLLVYLDTGKPIPHPSKSETYTVDELIRWCDDNVSGMDGRTEIFVAGNVDAWRYLSKYLRDYKFLMQQRSVT